MVGDHQGALTSLLEQLSETAVFGREIVPGLIDRDDLTKVHRHKETGAIEQLPKKFQLELIGTESEDRLDEKICLRDAIKMYEFDGGVERSKYFYEPKALDPVKSVYVTNAAEKQRGEETQLELYETGE